MTAIHTYDTFDRISANKDVDAVYLGLPNSTALRIHRAGGSCGQARALRKAHGQLQRRGPKKIDAFRQAKLKLMIAYRVQHDPTWNQAIQMIANGKIGQLQSFDGAFYGQEPPDDWRLSRRLAGGIFARLGRLSAERNSTPPAKSLPGKHPLQFGLEAEHFAARVCNNKEPKSPGEEGLKDMIAIGEIYKAASAPIA